MTDFDLGDPAPDADEEPTDDQDSSDGEQDSTDSVSEPSSDHFENVGPDPSEVDMQTDDGDDAPDPTETGPAFPYSEVDQNPLYAREETWREFNLKRDTELTPALREEGIMDDELREIHDIVLEIAMDNLDEIPERLKEKRRES